MKDICLFIGGPADGEWKTVDTRRDTWQIAGRLLVHETEKPLPIFTYTRQEFREGKNCYFIYTCGISVGSMFEALCRGYQRPTKCASQTSKK